MRSLLSALRVLDLRFESGSEEALFFSSIEYDIVRAVFVGCCAHLICTLGHFASDHFSHDFAGHDMPFQAHVGDSRTLVLLITVTNAAWHAALAVACAVWWRQHGRRRRRVGPGSAGAALAPAAVEAKGGWEIVSLVTFAMDNVLLIFGNNNILDDWYGLQDEEDASMKPQMPDGLHPLLTLCFLVCLQCSFSHVRFHRLWAMPLVSMLSCYIAIGLTVSSIGAIWPATCMSFLLCACQVYGAWKKESTSRRGWRLIADLKEQEIESERRYNIGMQLLSSFCDCVLSLDDDLCLLEPCPKLSAMLLRNPTSTSAGMSIREFMSAEDFRLVHGTVSGIKECAGCEKHTESQTACSLTVNLSDSMHAPVRVRMYFASLCKATGVQHMVGIVETSQWEQPNDRDDRGGDDMFRPSISERIQEKRETVISPEDDLLDGGMEGCTTDEFWDTIEAEAADLDVTSVRDDETSTACATSAELWARVRMSHGMEVQESSRGFTFALGVEGRGHEKLAPSSLASVLSNPEPVRQWLKERRAEIFAGQLQVPAQVDFGPVDVRLRLAGGSGATPLGKAMWLAIAAPESLALKFGGKDPNYAVKVHLTEVPMLSGESGEPPFRVTGGSTPSAQLGAKLLAVVPGWPPEPPAAVWNTEATDYNLSGL